MERFEKRGPKAVSGKQSATLSSGPSSALPWGNVIGMPVAVGNMDSISGEIVRLAKGEAHPGYVCVANVHMLVTARRHAKLRSVLDQASVVVSDGRPLVWNLRRQGFKNAGQVRGPELMGHLCHAAAEAKLPVFFYGGNESLITELRDQVEQLVPGIEIAGAEAAPMLDQEPKVDPETVERIRKSGAKIVFVSLGCPKQEHWMRVYSPHLDAVLIGVGQAFNITAGHTPEAPAWMRDNGLEWLFRLKTEPRRLWRRYLVTNSLFIAYVVQETMKKGLGRIRDLFFRKHLTGTLDGSAH
jgi:N-acetylglucosaminyldiphosphoundecaprenol N-acetyl-beta-D-mannosaminyltransferase